MLPPTTSNFPPSAAMNNISNQPGLPTPSTSPAHVERIVNPALEGGCGEETGFSDEASVEDQDEAQAALQPAISAAASHLTSAQTPAVEKAAALERLPGGGYFHDAVVQGEGEDDDGNDDNDDDNDDDSRSSPNGARPRHQVPGRLPMPSPWTSSPKSFLVNDKDSPRTRQTKSLLGSAFGPTRQHRSRSAGQEALKKLQRAFPSFSGHAGLFPSLPVSFLSNFTGDHKHGSNAASKLGGESARPRSLPLAQQSTTTTITTTTDNDSSTSPGHSPPASERPDEHTTMSRPRPSTLRRVTSDESMLYHSLSRQSSLGDDNKFDDVREMVNIRFMAIKDSLPDVPNFRMPSLARLQAASRMSSMALNGLFSSSNDDQALSRQSPGGVGRQMPGSSPSPSSPKPSTAAAATAFDRVVEKLTGDLVILGGYRGSVLRSAEPPHQQLWAPVKLGFNMRKANLEVGLEDEDEETMEERIIPSGMLKHVGPVDVSRKLFKRLRSSPNARNGSLRIWDFGYDWRLSPARSSRKLQEFLSELPSNRPGTPPESAGALVIAHSLGGLITRHAVGRRPELFAGVLYAGVPQRCINILGPFRNGDAVLFNEKLLTAQVNFSIRTSFVLLPDDGFCFIDKQTGESYPVDFFNADEWVRWRLSPCVAAPLLPPYHSRDKQQNLSSPLSSLFPNSLLKNKKPIDPDIQSSAAAPAPSEDHHHHHHHHETAPLPSPPQSPPPPSSSSSSGATASDQERYMSYLRRTLAATRQFRSELAHSKDLEAANAYPPHAVLYGKTIPTVYAAQVACREAIAYADAYDDLVFRPGDGVVLAREAMLPEGYAVVRSGRVSTERGHLTMLGDLEAVGRALEALLWGRQRGIGMGNRKTGDGRRETGDGRRDNTQIQSPIDGEK